MTMNKMMKKNMKIMKIIKLFSKINNHLKNSNKNILMRNKDNS